MAPRVRSAVAAACLLLVAAAAEARPLVVIDPGHGGSNAGAFGPGIGRSEKHLTLALARRLARALRALRPKIRIRLTRNRDRYVSLARRVAIANDAGADLFVSLHFNASPGHRQRGYETFVVDRGGADAEARRLALGHAREGGARPESPATSPEAAILRGLAIRGQHARSVALAREIQAALREARGAAGDRGVRQAPFDVLLGLEMPGVLVEVGFIDHPREGRAVSRPQALERIARAIAGAIGRFLERSAPTLADRTR